ncbi:hypothetical protein SNEBB_002810 [Seison nebaliae]|nr:hypothetical protein SNEBB_002810 [Seison nebaliae]
MNLVEQERIKEFSSYSSNAAFLPKKRKSSNEKTQVELKNGGTQTSNYETEETGTEMRKNKSKQTQTLNEYETDIEFSKVIPTTLTHTIGSKVDEIMKILKSNDENIYDYNPNYLLNESSTLLTKTFKSKNRFIKNYELVVTDMAFNCTSSDLAVCYGRLDHVAMCDHKGYLIIYKLYKNNEIEYNIELSSCISSVTFHPSHNSIFVVGTFNGEIFLYDSRKPDSNAMLCEIIDQNDFHDEAITQVIWIRDYINTKKKFVIATTSQDGIIKIWEADPAKTRFKLLDIFAISSKELSKWQRNKTTNDSISITCLAQCPSKYAECIVGSDCGGIFQCDFKKKFPLNKLKMPSIFTYELCDGPITSISYADTSDDQQSSFLTASTDGSIKLFLMLQFTPIYHFNLGYNFLEKALFLPSNTFIFFSIDEKDRLIMFNLSSAEKNMKEIAQLSGRSTSMCIDKRRSELLAISQQDASITIWRLGDEYVS